MQQQPKKRKFGDAFTELVQKLPAAGSGNPKLAAEWKSKYGKKEGDGHDKAGLTPLGQKMVDKVRGVRREKNHSGVEEEVYTRPSKVNEIKSRASKLTQGDPGGDIEIERAAKHYSSKKTRPMESEGVKGRTDNLGQVHDFDWDTYSDRLAKKRKK